MWFIDALFSWDGLLYGLASLAGWWCIAGVRTLPIGAERGRSPLAVIIPARNEALNIASVVASIRPLLRPQDEIVVVDDHSVDATAELAVQAGARVVAAPPLPSGWLGKPHACWVGANQTTAELLVFVDADVRMVGPDVLDRVAAAVESAPRGIVSVQPWHQVGSVVERAAALFNILSLMGSGAGRSRFRSKRSLVFGPVLACRRERYFHLGGHAHDLVRHSVIEDVMLGRQFGETQVFVGDQTTVVFRMYSGGLRSVIDGFSKNMAQGIRLSNAVDSVASTLWFAAVVGGLFTSPLFYLLSALQIALIQRRVGSFGPLTAIAYPVNALIFVIVLARSALVALGVSRVRWAGRRLP
jgi:4,4'-diaponeurosporenoate glycosyltransferase